MGFAQSICRTHWLVVAAALAACIAASTWAVTSTIVPKAESAIDPIIRKFDNHVPEIVIRNGEAWVDAEQPYYVDLGTNESGVVVIDTNMEDPGEAMKYLEGVKSGAVLTRNAIVVKNRDQYRIHSLKSFGNFVVNSDSLMKLKARYFPWLVLIGTIGVACYFFFSKLIQMLVLALFPLLIAGSRGLGYGEGLKIAGLAMVPAVVVGIMFLLFGMYLVSLAAYTLVYLVLIIVASIGLARASEPARSSSTPINP